MFLGLIPILIFVPGLYIADDFANERARRKAAEKKPSPSRMWWWLVPAFLLILVGLPLLAVVAARRLPPPRPRPLVGDFEWQLGRTYGLVVGDYLEVLRAGRAAAPERLQPAARALSEHVCGLNAFGRPLGTRLTGRQRAVGRAVWIAPTLMVLAVLAALVARHAYGAAIYAALYGVGYPSITVVGLRRRRRAARAAFEANAPRVAVAATPTVR